MEWFWYYAWYSISSLLLFFPFINHKSYKFVMFYNDVNDMWKLHGQLTRNQKWKCFMSLVMIQWKCVLNTKQEWRLTIKLKNYNGVKLCFYHVDCGFLHIIYCYEFFNLWAYFFFSSLHCGLHSLKVLHNKWCSPHYVCIMRKYMIDKIIEP
jgi:hypothetical protein